MDTSLLLYALAPIVIILCMLLIFKQPADISGIIGWLAVSIIAIIIFKTSLEVVMRSTIAGLIRSFSVSLIVATSLLQMAYMEKTGALKRVIIFIKTLSSENRAVQIMLLNIGFGTLMVAVGATPVSLLPPILLAMGYSAGVAIMLPAIGYDSLCTYALLGAPLVVFVDIANGFLKANKIAHIISLSEAGSVFAIFLPVVSISIGFCMLWIVGRWDAMKKGFIPCIVTGAVIGVVSYFTNRFDNLVVLTGVICGIAVIIAMLIYLLITGKKIIDRSRLTQEEMEYEKKYPLWKALMPWAILIVLILALNIPQELFKKLYYELKLPIMGVSADGKGIDTRALWNAYTWIFVSIILSIPFIKPTASQLKDTLSAWLKRALRPIFAAAIFFSIGEVMNMAGYNMVTKQTQISSMTKVLADYSANAFQSAYGAAVSFIGLFGGFITGSEASTLAMFANYTLKTVQKLNINNTDVNSLIHQLIIITAGLAFGGGLASVISPAKLQNAAASIDKLGEENKIIGRAFIFSLILTVISTLFVVFMLRR